MILLGKICFTERREHARNLVQRRSPWKNSEPRVAMRIANLRTQYRRAAPLSSTVEHHAARAHSPGGTKAGGQGRERQNTFTASHTHSSSNSSIAILLPPTHTYSLLAVTRRLLFTEAAAAGSKIRCQSTRQQSSPWQMGSNRRAAWRFPENVPHAWGGLTISTR